MRKTKIKIPINHPKIRIPDTSSTTSAKYQNHHRNNITILIFPEQPVWSEWSNWKLEKDIFCGAGGPIQENTKLEFILI